MTRQVTTDATAHIAAMPGAGRGDEVVRRIFRRSMWFLFMLLVVSIMDRINIAFAALTMNRDLGLSAATFGMSVTIFFAGYSVCEIPSNLLLARFGARLWIARMMTTWGLASAGTALAVGMWSLYGTRLLVGVAEADFFPGILFYLTSHRRITMRRVYFVVAALIVWASAALAAPPLVTVNPYQKSASTNCSAAGNCEILFPNVTGETLILHASCFFQLPSSASVASASLFTRNGNLSNALEVFTSGTLASFTLYGINAETYLFVSNGDQPVIEVFGNGAPVTGLDCTVSGNIN